MEVLLEARIELVVGGILLVGPSAGLLGDELVEPSKLLVLVLIGLGLLLRPPGLLVLLGEGEAEAWARRSGAV